MKRNRVTATSAVIMAIVAMFFFLPLPISRIRQMGLLQLTSEAKARGKVTVPDQAILEEMFVRNGDHVRDGTLLARFRSPKLEADRNDAETNRRVYLTQAEAIQRMMHTATDSEDKLQLQGEMSNARDVARQYASRITSLQTQIDRLRELRSPCKGIVMEAPKREDVGKLWEKEQSVPFCYVGDPAKLQVVFPVTPDDFRLLQEQVNPNAGKSVEVTMLLPGRGTNYLTGHIRRLREKHEDDVPIQLIQSSGGPIAVKPGTNPNIHEPQQQTYLVEIDLDQTESNSREFPYLVPGTQLKVKVHCQWRSCAWWAWRKISAMFDLGLI